jgi:hypothetical protein
MMPMFVDKRMSHEVFDDFDNLNTVASTGLWKSTKGTGGSLALASSTNGRINIPTAASQNDYQLLSTQNATFKFAPHKKLVFEALVNATEAATNQANFVVGLSSILTTGFLTTGNGGLPSSWDGAVWWKVGATLQWQFSTSKATTVTTNAAPVLSEGAVTYASGTDYTLGFVFDPNDGTTGLITPHFNGLPVMTAAGTVYTQTIALSSALLYPILGVVAGSASAETLTVDYVRVVQDR